MKKTEVERLAPFLKGYSAKSQFVIFLLSVGYLPEDIKKMTLKDLKNIDSLKDIPNLERNLDIVEGQKGGLVFCYPTGRKYSESHIISILERSYNKLGYKYINLSSFVKRIKGKN